MKTTTLLYILMATTAIGGAIALPAAAQTPGHPNATGNTSPPPPAATWPGTTTTPASTAQPVTTQLDAVSRALNVLVAHPSLVIGCAAVDDREHLETADGDRLGLGSKCRHGSQEH
jgi:hypothetical protein